MMNSWSIDSATIVPLPGGESKLNCVTHRVSSRRACLELTVDTTLQTRGADMARLIASCATLLLTTSICAAATQLPEGPGLAAKYAGDRGLAKDPAIVFF